MPGRYATALFELALERGEDELERISADLDRLRLLLDESTDLARLVRSPVFRSDEQARAMAAVAAKADFSRLTRNFIQLVIRNRRLFAIRDMIRAFRALRARHRGELTAEVRSATRLTDEQRQALAEKLRSGLGRAVQIEESVDPSLLGGLVVRVGSRMIDSSIRTKLNNLKIAMKEVG